MATVVSLAGLVAYAVSVHAYFASRHNLQLTTCWLGFALTALGYVLK